MGDALAWIGQIAEWVGMFVPRWQIVPATHAGLKFVRGSRMVALDPGIHFWWPVTTTLQMYPSARQTLDLRTQTLMTTDMKVVAVGGMVTYRVNNIQALLGTTWDADQTIKDICAGVISEMVRECSWMDLNAREFSPNLRNLMRRRLRPYGVRVMKATLTDCTPCKVIKLVQSTSNDVG